MHIQTCGGDNHVALAPGEDELALLVACCKVAGAEPAFIRRTCLRPSFTPFCLGDRFAADEDFAVVRHADFTAGKRLADAAACGVERMVQCDQRGGFRHAVALDEREAEPRPELLQIGRERGASAHERPELPPEEAMLPAEVPPAL